MDDSMEQPVDSQEQDIALETPPDDVFMAPSIDKVNIANGDSYSYISPVPNMLKEDMSIECVLGVDEAGRGPVLGPMVYGLYYLPLTMHRSLLADTHHFDDSKVLSPAFRSTLMQAICTPGTDLYESSGWATRVMSAKDISSAQMRPTATYNLNAQAMDATIDLIHAVFAQGVNLTEIYIDTIGQPAAYQRKLERIFPTVKITVAKKADSLYPCVSAASVCAKVTRDAALEVCYEVFQDAVLNDKHALEQPAEGWGSGYPSDARCSTWLRKNMDPLFGWGNECRFSWSTAKDLLDVKPAAKVNWPVADDEDSTKLTNFFMYSAEVHAQGEDQLSTWYGRRVTEDVF
ncbi:ribonuclease H-like protein [Aureobasidium sp. EXF-8845]|nr:ribonuclease H-like protein [Aureobasidium sp. EXF-8845]KAI4852156.1 ribonuclease H-like protein [Aureobasidium sp. EXF-8846]